MLNEEIIARDEADKEVELNTIIETMVDEMGDGGMDTSFIGHKYFRAKLKAIKQIKALIKK
jgi:hypothetical protein